MQSDFNTQQLVVYNNNTLSALCTVNMQDAGIIINTWHLLLWMFDAFLKEIAVCAG